LDPLCQKYEKKQSKDSNTFNTINYNVIVRKTKPIVSKVKIIYFVSSQKLVWGCPRWAKELIFSTAYSAPLLNGVGLLPLLR